MRRAGLCQRRQTEMAFGQRAPWAAAGIELTRSPPKLEESQAREVERKACTCEARGP